MKKFLGILFTFIISVCTLIPSIASFTTAYADTTKTTLNFNLTCDDKNTVSAQMGDIITVTHTLENITDNTAYSISSYGTQIYFDHTFFEYVENSAIVTAGLNLTTQLNVHTNGERRIAFNGFEVPAKEYAAKQIIGTFQLKVIATEGSSTLYHKTGLDANAGEYTISKSDLVVTVGAEVPTVQYTLTFETNGGSMITAVTKNEGETVNLGAYAPTKAGYTFEGWYSDSALTNEVTSVTLDGDKAVYAKWAEVYPTQFTVTFNANGGTEIVDIEVVDGGKITEPTAPQKEGKVFAGWYKDIDCTLAWNFEADTVSGDTTLYAKWIDDPTLDDSDDSSDTEQPSPENPDEDSSDAEQPSDSEDFSFKDILIVIGIILAILLVLLLLLSLLS